ncbi:unnamed protein product [Acanthoscelides obtectus]|uniref:Uncharacterized protein n=1 Tax=Acanthoscelides obtectus TaxID=200917 RepID=A0A9P0KCK2_ACAOB|nr:unnamed protein product [Acanthoscelides obtectus]CAK1677164.1 hypothetical protein AOBTE_LOCUS31152 [Acanthoscelides obtectus]
MIQVSILCENNGSRNKCTRSSSVSTERSKQWKSVEFSFQDNGSAKYFQSGIHTPKMGEKVAQKMPLAL